LPNRSVVSVGPTGLPFFPAPSSSYAYSLRAFPLNGYQHISPLTGKRNARITSAVSTLRMDVSLQPPGAVYVITDLPCCTPVTIPELAPMVAFVVVPLIHVPPGGSGVIVAVAATHTAFTPVISGNALTVIILVADAGPQSVVAVYDIVAVPAVMPVTVPVAFTVAVSGLRLLHVPPATPLVNTIDEAAQTEDEPDITPTEGRGLTVIWSVVTASPQVPEMV